MLIKRAVLDQIVAGDIDLVFRRWKRATVKTGGQLRTSVGMLNIVAVDRVAPSRITTAEARRAGFDTRAALLRSLASRPDGDVYRIAVRPGGADPRIALRERTDLSRDELDGLLARLARLDTASNVGPWTGRYLRLLAANPRVRAQDLADEVGVEKPAFKNNVRKLKTLGLTISHSPGYEISPRGLAVMQDLGPADDALEA